MKKPFFAAKTAFLALFLTVSVSFLSTAKPTQEEAAQAEQEHATETEAFNPGEVILEHVMDAHQWHISDHLVVPLPIIIYSSEKGLEVFSSSHFFKKAITISL